MIGMLSRMKDETKANKLKFSIIGIATFISIITLTVVVAAALSSYEVTITDAGQTITVTTRKTQAEEVLIQEAIETGQDDLLDTSGFSAGKPSQITIYRACTATLAEDGHKENIKACKDVAHTLKTNEIKLGLHDLVEPALSTPIEKGMQIRIKRAFSVSVSADGELIELETAVKTVQEALNQAGIALGEDDETNPPLDADLIAGEQIEVLRIENTKRSSQEKVKFGKEVIKTNKMYVGQTKVTQKGRDGLKEVVYKDRYVNGELDKTTVESETLTKEPISQITKVGTMIKVSKISFKSGLSPISDLKVPDDVKLDANGLPINYKRIVDGKASAYCEDGGQKTASGRPAMQGHVAVNPKQFPYGTRLYIVSHDGKYLYGYCIAADTGGFVKWANGPTVDLFFNTNEACRQFGVRNVRIYVLD